MGGGQTGFSNGDIATRVLPDDGGHQVSHGVVRLSRLSVEF